METLNPQQQEIVQHHTGPALVIAGAGSGKTRVITHRVAHLIQSGVDPSSIMMLTFTNKAAKEMADRVGQTVQVKNVQKAIIHGTFHSVANRFLRRYAALIRYENNFTILDDSDDRDLLKAAMAEAIGKADKNFPKAAVLQNMFSLAFNTNCDAHTVRSAEYSKRHFDLEALIDSNYYYLDQYAPEILKVFHTYRRKKRRNQAMSFDDLLENWLELLMHHRANLNWVKQVQHILVDEYQDTNKVQASILDQMAAEHRNLMVVGDDAQSIYSWRGANFRNILDFPNQYNAATFRLEQNYRSTPDILELANNSINFNSEQFEKELYTRRPNLEKPVLYKLFDPNAEAEIVVERILKLQDEDVSLNEMAVLYRSHVQAATLQVVLTQRGIPFLIRSGVKFFDQAHMKDIVSFLKVVFNPLDEIAWMRLLKMLPGIGNTTSQKIFNVFVEQQSVRLTADNEALQKRIPKKARAQWDRMLGCFKEMLREDITPSEMVAVVFREFYRDYMMLSFENPIQREADIHYLQEFAEKYKTLDRLLNELSLVGASVIKDHEADNYQEDEYLTLTTIHQAKGLEWDAVFLIGLTESQFPNQRCVYPEALLEEERRLFYVAITRARKYLSLTAPLITSSFGNNEMSGRSRFVEELPEDLLNVISASYDDYESYYMPRNSRMIF